MVVWLCLTTTNSRLLTGRLPQPLAEGRPVLRVLEHVLDERLVVAERLAGVQALPVVGAAAQAALASEAVEGGGQVELAAVMVATLDLQGVEDLRGDQIAA